MISELIVIKWMSENLLNLLEDEHRNVYRYRHMLICWKTFNTPASWNNHIWATSPVLSDGRVDRESRPINCSSYIICVSGGRGARWVMLSFMSGPEHRRGRQSVSLFIAKTTSGSVSLWTIQTKHLAIKMHMQVDKNSLQITESLHVQSLFKCMSQFGCF